MNIDQQMDKVCSRRYFLKGAGTAALGAAGITALASSVPGVVKEAAAVGASLEKWPWPYVKLDPDKTAELAAAKRAIGG